MNKVISTHDSTDLSTALLVPTIFSDDLERPLQDIGLADATDQELMNLFAGRVLDIGSGVEGFARGLQEKAARLGKHLTIVSLNPQFIDWYHDEHDQAVYKLDDINRQISEKPFGSEYLADHRLAVSGLVQALPFRDESFDTVVSTWCFPTVFQEWRAEAPQFITGFLEIIRVLKSGGIARLSPVRNERSILSGRMNQNQMHLMLQSINTEGRFNWQWSEYPLGGGINSDLSVILTLHKKAAGVVR